MKKTILYIIGALQLSGCLTYPHEEWKALLTNDSVKYWDSSINTITGLCFDSNEIVRSFQYGDIYTRKNQDSCRYFTYSCQEVACERKYRFEKDFIVFFYDEPCPSDVGIERYKIKYLMDDSMAFEQKGEILSYKKSRNQYQKLESNPFSQGGFELARLASSTEDISIIIQSVIKECTEKQIDTPSTFNIKINCYIDDEGNVYKNNIFSINEKELSDSKSQYEHKTFYEMLLDRIKTVKFIPAQNKEKGKFYFCNVILPIKYFAN